MKKRLISILLALCMALALLPAAVFGADGDGLTKLANPTDLKWDTANPGVCTWTTNGAFQGSLSFKIYKDGDSDPKFFTLQEYSASYTSTAFSLDHFSRMYDGWGSGNYYFTVQNLGDGIQYSDSDEISSKELSGGVYHYNEPTDVLPTPEQVTWSWPKSIWTLPSGADQTNIKGYWVQYGFSDDTTAVEPYYDDIGGTEMAQSGGSASWLQEKLVGEWRNGAYFFRVRALSNNIEKAQNGAFSPWSAAYDLGAASDAVKDALTNLNGSAATPDAIKQGVQDLDPVKLEDAMRADLDGSHGTLDALAKLEQKAGGPAAVTVDSGMTDFTAGDISVVGANLNNTSGTGNIGLNVGAANPKDIRDELYDSAVAVNFSMTLANAAASSKLDVPVKITLPIPANINPDYLVILHYHLDNSYEEVYVHTYQDNSGKWFASFVLTSFSDFVMTQTKDADPVPTPTTYKINVTSGTNGTVSASAATAAEGTEITVTVTPNANFTANAPVVTGPSGTVAVNKKSDTQYSFTMPAGDVTVSAVFTAVTPAPDEYTVTLPAAPSGGTVTADVTKAKAGAAVTLTVTPAANYTASAPVVTGPSGTVAVNKKSDTQYSFIMPAGDVSVDVTFMAVTPGKYAVTLPPASSEGTVTADVTEAAAGDTVTLTVTPSTNFTANAPVVTGPSGRLVVTEVNSTTYTFVMPAGNVSVAASFSVIELTLAYTPYANMTDADKKLYYGGKLEITGLVPNTQYVVTLDNGLAASKRVNGRAVIPRIAHAVTSDAAGKIALGCQDSMNVMVFGVAGGGDVTKDLVELYARNHAGVPVSSLASRASGT